MMMTSVTPGHRYADVRRKLQDRQRHPVPVARWPCPIPPPRLLLFRNFRGPVVSAKPKRRSQPDAAIPPSPPPLSLLRSYVFQVPEEGDENLAYNDVEGQGVPGRVFNTNLRSPDVEYEPPTYEGDMAAGNDAEEGGKMPHVAAEGKA